MLLLLGACNMKCKFFIITHWFQRKITWSRLQDHCFSCQAQALTFHFGKWQVKWKPQQVAQSAVLLVKNLEFSHPIYRVGQVHWWCFSCTNWVTKPRNMTNKLWVHENISCEQAMLMSCEPITSDNHSKLTIWGVGQHKRFQMDWNWHQFWLSNDRRRIFKSGIQSCHVGQWYRNNICSVCWSSLGACKKKHHVFLSNSGGDILTHTQSTSMLQDTGYQECYAIRACLKIK